MGLLRGLVFGIAIAAVPVAAVTFTADVGGINTFTGVDKISWTDSKGLTREAYFAKNHPTNAKAKGYITRFTYQTNSTTTITCDEPSVGSDLSGFGFTVNHNSSAVGWSNQKKDGFNFAQAPSFEGTHHLQYHVTFSEMGNKGTSTDSAYLVTVDWTFMDGIDHFIYSITYNGLGKTYPDDSRSPYSEFPWEGNNAGISNISGMSYGSDSLFMVPALNASNAANSPWTFNKANLIPYVWEWVNNPSRECGYIQTQTWKQKKGGGGEWMPASSGTVMPDNWRLAYQMNSYQGWVGHRLTWGEDYGFLTTAVPKVSWNVAMMIDQRSDSGVTKLITETEKIQTAGGVVMIALQGTLATKGVKGSGDTVVANYAPIGFNHVYRCWKITPDAANIARFNFNVSSGSYHSPVFVLDNYTGTALPTIVSMDGTTLVDGTGYYASLDQTNHRLWVTILGSISGGNIIGINSNQTGVRMPGLVRANLNAVGKIKGVYNLAGKAVPSIDLNKAGEKTNGVYIVRRTVNGREVATKTLK